MENLDLSELCNYKGSPLVHHKECSLRERWALTDLTKTFPEEDRNTLQGVLGKELMPNSTVGAA